MTDFDASFARLQARVQTQKAARIEKWERIKRDAPEIASFLTEINQVFGKPAKVAVVIHGERVL